MNIVTLSIGSREEVSRRAAAAFPRRGAGRAHLVRLGWPALEHPDQEASGDSESDDRPRRIGRDGTAPGRPGRQGRRPAALLHAGVLDQADPGVAFPL